MGKRLCILVMAFTIVSGILCLPAAFADSGDGYWKFSHTKVTKNETREKTNWGVHNKYATGGSSGATYNYEGDWVQGHYEFQVRFTYGGIPAVLIPGQEYSIPMSAHVTKNVRPKDQIKLLLGAGAFISHTRRSQASVESLSNASREYSTAGFVSVRLNHSTPDELSDTATAKFIPPTAGKDREEYAVQIIVQSELFYTCIYKWQPGTPTDEEKASMIPATDDTPQPWPKGAVGRIYGIRGNVSVQRSGLPVLDPAKEGMFLFPGDGIKTDSENYAAVNLILRDPDRLVRVTRGTYFVIERKSDSIENIDQWVDKHGMGLVSLIVGRIWLRATRGEEALRFVTTASAIAGVRGTTFSVEVRENGGEQFSCYTGEIFVEPTAESLHPEAKIREVTVKAGQAANFTPRGQMIGVRDLTDEEMSVGWILGRPDITQTEVPPEEKQGNRAVQRESGDWRLDVYERSNIKHGILIYDGQPIGDVGRDRLTSPFGILKYHGPFASDGKSDSGWLPVDDTADEPAAQAQPPAEMEALPDPGK